jgi:WASH complex subunit 7
MGLLEISRRLNAFVSRFKYNLQSQFYVEMTNEQSKHVHSISISHINSSLRTHGAGIVSTVINATYKLLVKKFQTFS